MTDSRAAGDDGAGAAGAFTTRAWRRAAPIRAAIDEQPLVRGLGDGTLSEDRFNYYMTQDALYLVEYGRVLAGVASLSGEPDEFAFWCDCAKQALVAERELHAAHVDLMSGATASPTCRAYTDFLHDGVALGSYGVAVAAVLPCFWIYQDVGAGLLARAGDLSGHPYGDWISTYADPAFEQSTARARGVADRLAAAAGDDERGRMHEAFATACRYEWMFCDTTCRIVD